MAIGGVAVIHWAIEIDGHQADYIQGMLLTHSFAELNSGDLGNGAPLIRGFKRPCE